MCRHSTPLCLAGALVLAGCAAAPPAGPTVVAMPGQGKSFETFQQDDVTCRSYAGAQTGQTSPAQAATNAGVGSALLGTAIGAGAGAAIGSTVAAVGAGAAIGGAAGLLAGSAIGANNAYASAASLQQRYDIGYAQCMTAKGDSVQPVPAAYPYGYGVPYAYAPYPYYPYYAYPYGYAPAYWGPNVVVGFGGWGGWGWHNGYGHYGYGHGGGNYWHH